MRKIKYVMIYLIVISMLTLMACGKKNNKSNSDEAISSTIIENTTKSIETEIIIDFNELLGTEGHSDIIDQYQSEPSKEDLLINNVETETKLKSDKDMNSVALFEDITPEGATESVTNTPVVNEQAQPDNTAEYTTNSAGIRVDSDGFSTIWVK